MMITNAHPFDPMWHECCEYIRGSRPPNCKTARRDRFQLDQKPTHSEKQSGPLPPISGRRLGRPDWLCASTPHPRFRPPETSHPKMNKDVLILEMNNDILPNGNRLLTLPEVAQI